MEARFAPETDIHSIYRLANKLNQDLVFPLYRTDHYTIISDLYNLEKDHPEVKFPPAIKNILSLFEACQTFIAIDSKKYLALAETADKIQRMVKPFIDKEVNESLKNKLIILNRQAASVHKQALYAMKKYLHFHREDDKLNKGLFYHFLTQLKHALIIEKNNICEERLIAAMEHLLAGELSFNSTLLDESTSSDNLLNMCHDFHEYLVIHSDNKATLTMFHSLLERTRLSTVLPKEYETENRLPFNHLYCELSGFLTSHPEFKITALSESNLNILKRICDDLDCARNNTYTSDKEILAFKAAQEKRAEIKKKDIKDVGTSEMKQITTTLIYIEACKKYGEMIDQLNAEGKDNLFNKLRARARDDILAINEIEVMWEEVKPMAYLTSYDLNKIKTLLLGLRKFIDNIKDELNAHQSLANRMSRLKLFTLPEPSDIECENILKGFFCAIKHMLYDLVQAMLARLDLVPPPGLTSDKGEESYPDNVILPITNLLAVYGFELKHCQGFQKRESDGTTPSLVADFIKFINEQGTEAQKQRLMGRVKLSQEHTEEANSDRDYQIVSYH